MKVLIAGDRVRYLAHAAEIPAAQKAEMVFADREASEEELLAAAPDAEVLFVDPVEPVSERVIAGMPRLKMIHCEGVGVDRIDLAAARRRGVYVCNNAGCNAPAVAELSITLMSMLLHRSLWGDSMVRRGLQNEAVNETLARIPRDLSDCTVGLVGFGSIAQAAAERLRAYGARLCYWTRRRRDGATAERFGVRYLPLEELAAQSHVVSLYLPANEETTGLIGRDFLSRMQPDGYLVNTGRGAVIDDRALCEALERGTLAGAALDAYFPEPVTEAHPLVRFAVGHPDKLIFSPHVGGITASSYRRAHGMMWADVEKLAEGKRPDHVVNGL